MERKKPSKSIAGAPWGRRVCTMRDKCVPSGNKPELHWGGGTQK